MVPLHVIEYEENLIISGLTSIAHNADTLPGGTGLEEIKGLYASEVQRLKIGFDKVSYLEFLNTILWTLETF